MAQDEIVLVGEIMKSLYEKADLGGRVSRGITSYVNDRAMRIVHDNATEMIDATAEKVLDYLQSDKGHEMLGGIVKEITGEVEDRVRSVIRAWYHGSRVMSLGKTLIQGLTYSYNMGDDNILIITYAFMICDVWGLSTLSAGVIITALRACWSCLTNQQPHSLMVEAEDSTYKGPLLELFTALWQTMTAVAGIAGKVAPDSMTSMLVSLAKSLETCRSICGLLSTVCSGIYAIYMWISDFCNGVKPLGRLLYQNRSVMTKWAVECQELLDPGNEYLVIDNQSWYARLVAAHLVGKFFLREVSTAGVKDIPPTLISTQRQLTVLYQKAVNLGVVSSLRPEPVCVWVSGPPGVGKSYMKDKILRKLMHDCGIKKTDNDIYTVNFSQKHWTGAENKAVVYYDDFATVDAPEVLSEGIGQFMQLISDSRFSPPQAGIEDKGKPVAPSIVYCNANEAIPQFIGLRDPVAFLRRRHFCVGVSTTKEFTQEFGAKGNLETKGAKDWLAKRRTAANSMPHVTYYFYDPVTGQSENTQMTFEEMVEELSIRVTIRFDESKAKWQEKVDNMTNTTDIKTDTPLSEVLDTIRSRTERLCSDSPTVHRLFNDTYSMLVDSAEEVAKVTKGWIASIMGSTLETQAEDEAQHCQCLPNIHHNVELDGEKFRYTDGWNDGLEYIYKCKDPKCILKSPAWQKRITHYVEHSHRKNVATVKRLLQVIQGVEYNPSNSISVQVSESDFETIRISVKEPEIPGWVKFGGIALLSIGSFLALKKIVEKFTGKSSLKQSITPLPRKTVSAELLSSGDNHTSRTATKHKTGIVRKAFISQGKSLEDALTCEASANLLPILDKASCYLMLSGVDRSSQAPVNRFKMRVFALGGTWLLMPKHYMAKINRTDNAVLEFINYSATLVITVDIVDTKELDNSELMLVRLPKTIPAMKDMRKHFMKESEARLLTNKGYAFEKDLGEPAINHPLTIKISHDVTYRDGDAYFVLPCALQYEWQAPGRCMTPIYSKVSSDKIVGFHVMGGDATISGKGVPVGCAEPVCYETFCDLDLGLTAAGQLTCEGYADEANPMVILDTNVAGVGFVKPSHAVKPADKTQIVPSGIHGYVRPTTRPAPLTPGHVQGAFSPLRTGVEKHGRPPKQFDEALLARAKQALLDQYLSACKPVRQEVGVLSVEEAILGLPGVEGYAAMELSTSEGYPWTASRPVGERNKRYLFNISDARDSVEVSTQLTAALVTKEKMRRSGIVPFTVFTDCLKDSRIPEAKFLTPGKTRIFSISPVDFTIQFRQYFLDIMASQKVHRINMEHMVGINVHSIEWTFLARRLLEVGEHVLCGDYSNFGPGLSSQVVEAVGDVWVKWFDFHEAAGGIADDERQHRRNARRVMFEEMRHSVHLCGNVLYQAPCGSPSGAPCTVNINNDVNKLYVYMAWLKCYEDNPLMSTIVAFRKHCRLFVYGDDLVCGVSDVVKDKFNNVFLQRFFADHDIAYTDERKTGEIVPFVSFKEAGFLKGVWNRHPTRPGVFTYGLSKSSLEDIANWCTACIDLEEGTRQACADSLMLAYGWGPEYFNDHRARLLAAWGDRMSTPLALYGYDDMEAMRFGWNEGLVSSCTSMDDCIDAERKWRERCRRETVAGVDSFSLIPDL